MPSLFSQALLYLLTWGRDVISNWRGDFFSFFLWKSLGLILGNTFKLHEEQGSAEQAAQGGCGICSPGDIVGGEMEASSHGGLCIMKLIFLDEEEEIGFLPE